MADKVYDMEYVIDHASTEFTQMCPPKPKHLKTASEFHGCWIAKIALHTEVMRQSLRTTFEGKRAVFRPEVAARSHATAEQQVAKRFTANEDSAKIELQQ